MGVKVDDVTAQTVAVPVVDKGKARDVSDMLPQGGYLGAKLAPKPSIQPTQSTPVSSATVNTSNAAHILSNPDQSNAQIPVATARISTGGNPGGGGGDSGSSSNDSKYRHMNRDKKRAYKLGKKEYQRNKERHIQQEKMEKLKLSGFKTKLPSSYDGTADYDTFE